MVIVQGDRTFLLRYVSMLYDRYVKCATFGSLYPDIYTDYLKVSFLQTVQHHHYFPPCNLCNLLLDFKVWGPWICGNVNCWLSVKFQVRTWKLSP